MHLPPPLKLTRHSPGSPETLLPTSSLLCGIPQVFYAVWLGHVPGIYKSWKEAQPQTAGIHTDCKRFTSRQKAEDYMAMTSGPGNPLLDDAVAFLFTDGSALPNGTSGWGVHITYRDRTETKGLWGPVVTSARSPN